MIFLRVLVKISPAQNKTFSREASVFHGHNFRNEIKKSIHYNFDGHNYKKPMQIVLDRGELVCYQRCHKRFISIRFNKGCQ